ncbi:MAG: hypothetical protein K2N90_02650 [Lachnospiraceae bacterium]|nr:hypothetical protein [Lachnospiraceae bacterium]
MGKIRQYINNKTVIIAAIVVCVVISVVTAVRIDTFWPYIIEIDMDEMSGSMVTDDDGSKYLNSGSSGYALYGPYMTLYKGYYTIDVDYSTDNDCTFNVHSNAFSDYIEAGDIVLKPQSTHKSFNIRLKDEVDDLELRVKYNGYGTLRVNSITITENTVGIRTSSFLAFAIVIFLTTCYLYREKIAQNKFTLAALAAITFLSCAPEMAQGMCTGHDGTFHLFRIEGLAEGLRLGEFPVRMQSNWMEGYGYPVSIYYGDILLYIPALLRIIGFSVTQSYKAYLFLINLGTTLAAYVCFQKIVKNSRVALYGTAGYVFATYRLTNVYVRLAVGEYSAIMFLPLVLLAVYRIYTEDAAELRKYMKNAVLLAVGMTGLVQTHLISVATVSLIIAFVCIVMFRKTLRKNTLIVYASAVAMTVAINLFFLVPFMDYSKNVPVEVLNDSEEAVAETIQGAGAYISQYFMLYQRAFGASGTNIGDRMAITPGIVLMAVLFVGIYFCIKYQDKSIRFMTLMSVLLLWMASNLFPWNFIINHVPLMGWISKIQFPWRFLPVAQLFLSLLLCMLFLKIKEERREHVELALLVLLIVTTAQMFSGVTQQRSHVEKYDTAGIDSFSLVNGEYVREGTKTKWFDGKVRTNNAEIIEDYTKQGKYAIIECETLDGEDGAWVELPILNYKNYVAYGEKGIRLNIADGENNVIRVMLPSGYSGGVVVTYEIPLSYKVADIFSFITVAAIAAIMILLKKKQSIQNKGKQMK